MNFIERRDQNRYVVLFIENLKSFKSRIILLSFVMNFQMGFSDVDSDNKPVSFQQTCEAKRSIHLQELQQKEDEMRQMFVARVKEKEAELKEAEKDVTIF